MELEGYEVQTTDDCNVGHVVGEQGNFLIVEHGTLLKHRRPIPRSFVTDDGERTLRASIPKAVFDDAPTVDGDFDEGEVAEYYGLVEAFDDPDTLGSGEQDPDESARTAQDDALSAGITPGEQQRSETRSNLENDPALESRGRQIIPEDPHR